jgi:hypothetical protein
MTVQDDARERQMARLFNLSHQPDGKRGGIDATLAIGDLALKFELKSATATSVSTVRDFGPNHVEKWDSLHWLFGFYDISGNDMLRCYRTGERVLRPLGRG